jgi:peptide/nickel transport system permease protein
MTLAIHPSALAEPREAPMLRQAFIMLTRDKFACAAALFLLAVLFCVFFGDYFFGEYANVIHLGARNAAPFSLGHGWMFFLGGDALGRSMLARVIVGARNTIAVAAAAVACSFLIGVTLGLLAGYRDGEG